MVPAHEAIARELNEDPSVTVRLDEAMADGSLPPCYHQNPTTLRNPEAPPIPLAIYMDSLPYSLVDSVLGVWIINLLTGS